jgi:uncharacterized repeat protein (TIGR01451 family)
VPVVALRVRVPAVSAPNAELQYRILVENTSRANAHHVIVRNPLPANVVFVRATPEPSEKGPELRWSLDTLAPGAHKEIVLVLKPTGGTEIRNCARVQYDHGEIVTTRLGEDPAAPPAPMPPPASPAPSLVAAPVSVAPPIPVAPPTVEAGKAELLMRIVGPPQQIVRVGPAVDFRTDVKNVGTVTAKSVVLTNTLPAGLDFSTSKPSVSRDEKGVVSWNLGDIPPGQTRSVTCTALPLKVGAYTVRAEARDAAGGNGEATSNLAVGEPRLSIVTAGPTIRLINRPASYVTTVTNTGTMPVANVVVKSEITEGMTLLRSTGGGFISPKQHRLDSKLNRNVDYQEIRWSLGTLAAGEKRRIEMVLQTANTGTLDHIVWAEAGPDLKERSDVRTTFEEATGMSLEIVKTDDPVEVGGEVKYTLRAINQGDGAAKSVVVTAAVPPEMEILKDKMDAKARIEGQTVTFELPDLARKTSQTFELKVKALKPGDVRLKVTLHCDQLRAGPVTQEESTTIVGDK